MKRSQVEACRLTNKSSNKSACASSDPIRCETRVTGSESEMTIADGIEKN